MPGWNRPVDVWFDHAAAGAAVEAVARLRFVLVTTWESELAAAEAALATWEGLAATAFGASFGARANRTADAEMRLRLLETALDDAIDDALREQARIDQLQMQWDLERRLEMEAERLAAADAGPSSARVR